MQSIRVCLVSAHLALLVGCGKSFVPPPLGPLNKVFSSWESGQRDEAVRLLISIDWDDPGLLSNSPALFTLTEQEFMSKWQYTRKRILKDEILPSVSLSRDLALHAIVRGQALREAGDKQQAETHYNAVKSLGSYLAKPERLEVTKLAANAIVGMADEQLSQLDSPLPNSEGR